MKLGLPNSSPTGITIALSLLVGCVTANPSLPNPEPALPFASALRSSRYLDQTVYIAKFSPQEIRLSLEIHQNPGELEGVSAMFERNPQAILGVNGGFFTSAAQPAGFFKREGQLLNLPIKNRGVVGFRPTPSGVELRFDRLAPDGIGGIRSAFSGQPWWEDYPDILGGAPLLLFNGEILDPEEERVIPTFATEPRARTAICTDKSSQIFFVVVEGGDTLTSKIPLWNWLQGKGQGLNLRDLSNYLKSLGCEFALNLDGGSSTTLIWHGKKLNKGSLLSQERPVHDSLIVSQIVIINQ